MKKEDFEYLSADGKTMIHAIRWIPDGEIKGVLQICHGMMEYIGRYEDFTTYMAEHGFYVVGNDHLGHGASVVSKDDHGYFGHPDGNKHVIADIHQLRKLTENDPIIESAAGSSDRPLPYFMLGHSMGSFLLRQYLTMYGEGLNGAIIMGTGFQPAASLKAGKAFCKTLAMVKGWRHRSLLIYKIAMGNYNKRIEPLRTRQDWLARKEQVVDDYRADPWCSFLFTVNAFYQMFSGMQVAFDKKEIAKTPRDLPLLVVAGAEDPVGAYGEGVKKTYDCYVKAGISDIKMKLYEEDRHEILHEVDKEMVYDDLLAWISERL